MKNWPAKLDAIAQTVFVLVFWALTTELHRPQRCTWTRAGLVGIAAISTRLGCQTAVFRQSVAATAAWMSARLDCSAVLQTFTTDHHAADSGHGTAAEGQEANMANGSSGSFQRSGIVHDDSEATAASLGASAGRSDQHGLQHLPRAFAWSCQMVSEHRPKLWL